MTIWCATSTTKASTSPPLPSSATMAAFGRRAFLSWSSRLHRSLVSWMILQNQVTLSLLAYTLGVQNIWLFKESLGLSSNGKVWDHFSFATCLDYFIRYLWRWEAVKTCTILWQHFCWFLVVMAGAWLGFWVFHKFVLTEHSRLRWSCKRWIKAFEPEES